MRNLNEQEKHAFARIRKTGDGLLLINLLQESLSEQDVNNRVSPIDSIQRGQGKSICLAELLDRLNQE